MKLYSCKLAPNAQKVLYYMALKDITRHVEIVEVDLMRGENMKEAYKGINPLGKIPTLQLDDGTFITESLSIIEYLETLYPTVPQLGTTPEDRAHIMAIERFIDFEIMGTMGIMAHQMMPIFKSRFDQSKDVVVYGRARQEEALQHLDQFIGDGLFVYGDSLTLADITLYVTMKSSYIVKAALDPKFTNIERVLNSSSQILAGLLR